MTDDELLDAMSRLKSAMIAVSTGGPAIDSVNAEYRETWRAVDNELRQRRLEHLNPHRDLWDWYGRWSDGGLPRYVDRRAHVRELYAAVEDAVSVGSERRHEDNVEPTGWDLVDRQIERMRTQLRDARSPEDFQGVGLLGREVIISLAQAVYRPAEDKGAAGRPSDTDAKRMLDEYIAASLPGAGNEEWRRAVRSVLQAAVALQHDRRADRRSASLCYELTVATVNCVAKLEEDGES